MTIEHPAPDADDSRSVAELLAALAAHPRLTDDDLRARAELRERIRNHPTEPAPEYGVRRTWWTGPWAQQPACGIETNADNPFDRQQAEATVAFYRAAQAAAGLPVDAELVTRQWAPPADIIATYLMGDDEVIRFVVDCRLTTDQTPPNHNG
ncbi:hypothetical protein AB0F88_17355 [Streptosporangium sp. NPDC023963]|uniref:hypothetical protein n=1 Tax=Streptosporangium sp. NPDC023963 TaxID=3155608 RepID=UPI00342B0411